MASDNKKSMTDCQATQDLLRFNIINIHIVWEISTHLPLVLDNLALHNWSHVSNWELLGSVT